MRMPGTGSWKARSITPRTESPRAAWRVSSKQGPRACITGLRRILDGVSANRRSDGRAFFAFISPRPQAAYAATL